MTNPEEDPGASTQQFRAYVAADRAEPQKPDVRRGRVAVAVLVAIAVVVVAIVVFALTR